MNTLHIEFESGDRSDPDAIERVFRDLIPTNTGVFWVSSSASRFAETTEGKMMPFTYEHKVRVTL